MTIKAKELSPQQVSFIDSYLQHGNATRAAIDAGYSTASARSTGCRLLKNEIVAEHIGREQRKVMTKSGYGLKACLQEAEEMRQFAIETKNANAAVKAVELKAKLVGLIDGPDRSTVAPLIINIGNIHESSIETSFEEVPSFPLLEEGFE